MSDPLTAGARSRSFLLRYGLAVLATALALALARVLYPLIQPHYFFLFLLSVALTAWYGGLRPGLLATLLSVFAVNYAFFHPRRPFEIVGASEAVRLGLFLIAAITMSVLNESLLRARARAEQQAAEHRRLRRRAEEATAEAEESAVQAEEAAAAAEESSIEAEEALHKAEVALQQKEDTLAVLDSMFASIPVGLCFLDRDLRYVRINDALAKMQGVTADQHIGHTVSEMVSHRSTKIEPLLRSVFDTGNAVGSLEVNETRGPKVGSWLEYFFPVHSAKGEIRYVGIAVVDISDRKRAEEATRQSEERYRSLVAATASVVWTTDGTGAFIKPQRSWQKYTGQTWEQHAGWGWAEALHPDDRIKVRARWSEAIARRMLYESEGRIWHSASNSYRYFVARAVPILSPEGSVREWIGTVTDVHDRRQAEEALTYIVEASGVLASSLDKTENLERIAHLAVPRLADSCVLHLVTEEGGTQRAAAVHADPIKAALLDEMLRRYPGDPQAPHGHPMVVRTGQSELIEDVPKQMLEELAEDDAHRELLRKLDLKSSLCVPLIARDRVLGALTFATSGSGRRYGGADVAMAEDIARRAAIAIDNARLYRKAQAAEEQFRDYASTLERRVAARTADLQDTISHLEAFSYSVSHDLRAPLRAMQGYTEAMLDDYGDKLEPTGKEYGRRIIAAARQMGNRIQDLLAYSRLSRAELKPQSVALSAVVNEALAQLESEVTERGARIDVAINGASSHVTGHGPTLVHVVSNLISNAIKFVSPKVEPRIRVWSECGNRGVRLWVEDNGIGIALQYHERIFKVFERLYGGDQYPGTGIGLAIVRKGIERMGGRVGVESELGKGSRFWIELGSAAPPQ